jgi:hypothetical protein
MRGRSLAKQCDAVIMFAIFGIVASYIVLYFILTFNSIIIIPMRLYQICASAELTILGLCLLWKAYRLDACAFTKIAVWMYIIFTVTSLIYCIFPFGYRVLLDIFMWLFVGGAVVMGLLYSYRLCYLKFGR